MTDADDIADSTVTASTTHVTTVDPDERPSQVVIAAVAAITGEQPVALSPLYDAIDPDALDSLVAHARETATTATHRLTFDYEGCEVAVHGTGRVEITETAPTAA